MQRTVQATNALSWVNLIYNEPYKPWRSAHFMNYGPSAVEVHINYPPHADYGFTIEPGKTKEYSEEPIKIIYLRSHPGLESKVMITGEL